MGLDFLLENQLSHWQKFQKLAIFKIAILEHETWQVAKVPEVAHIALFYPKRSKLSLFSLYGQRFPRYGPIFKNCTHLGMKLDHQPKFQKLHIYRLSTPEGQN